MNIGVVETYDVPCRVTGELHLAGHGAVAFELEQGQFVPADSKMASVLERLAAAGVVTKAEPKSTTKKKPEPVAAEASDKE
jgi:hypothetical protein